MQTVISSMIEHKDGTLLPCSIPTMFRIFAQYKKDQEIEWPVNGRPPIISNSALLNAVRNFELDENRAVSKVDMNLMLKNAKVEVAREKVTLP